MEEIHGSTTYVYLCLPLLRKQTSPMLLIGKAIREGVVFLWRRREMPVTSRSELTALLNDCQRTRP